MPLQLSHIFLLFIPLHPVPSSHHHFPTFHVHRSYIQILWLLHFLYYSLSPPVCFVPTIMLLIPCTFPPFSPFLQLADIFHVISISVILFLFQLLAQFVFVFVFSSVNNCELVVILLFIFFLSFSQKSPLTFHILRTW